MHKASYDLMEYFIKKYLPQDSIVLDFGGADINGSYKDIVINNKCTYLTLDWNNADYIVKDYDWKNVPQNYFDTVITGQAFEHDSYFWKSLENIKNVCKNNAIVIVIVPSKGNYHTHPIDCYRFYPDSAKVFAEILNADILEIVWNSDRNSGKRFIKQSENEWGDLGMVFKLKK